MHRISETARYGLNMIIIVMTCGHFFFWLIAWVQFLFPPMQGRAGVARRFHSDFVVPKV